MKPTRLLKLCSTALLSGALIACGAGSNSISIDVDTNLTREQRWEVDIAFMVERMNSVHPDLFHVTEKSEFETATETLIQELPQLNDEQLYVRLLALFASPAIERDGHMAMSFFQGTDFLINPLKFYQFEDGVYLIQALNDNQAHIGTKLVAVEGLALDAVNDLIDPLIPRDNQQSLEAFRNLLYITPGILKGLDIASSATQVTYTLESSDGTQFDMAVDGISPRNFPLDPSYNLPKDDSVDYLSNRGDIWMEHVQSSKTVYIKLNKMVDSDGSENLQQVAQQALAIIENEPLTKLVLDIRQNNGGNNGLVPGIIEFLSHPHINQDGKLLIFTDRQTFSAAGNLASEIAYRTNAQMIGVSPGGAGTQFGDSEEYRLPSSGILVYIPTRFWQFGDPAQQSLSLEMDQWIDLSIEDYLNKIDPLYEMFVK